MRDNEDGKYLDNEVWNKGFEPGDIGRQIMKEKSCINCIKKDVCGHSATIQTIYRDVAGIRFGGNDNGIKKLYEAAGEVCRFYSGDDV